MTLGLAMIFLDITPKAKTKIDEWDYNKMNNFCASKDTANRVKRHLTA